MMLPNSLLATSFRWYVPMVLAAGIPLIVKVPSWLSINFRPVGRVPTTLRSAAGKPVVMMVKLLSGPP